MPVPLPRLALVAVAVALIGLVSPWSLLTTAIVANAIVAVLFVVDVVLAPAPASIVVTRVAPSVLTVGQRGRLEWIVGHPHARRLTVWVADELAPTLGAGHRRFRVDVPAGARAEVTTELQPTRRGAFDIGEMVVRVAGPLRLGARQAARRDEALLRVNPPFRSREEAELRISKSRILDVGLRSTRGRGGGTDFDQLRDYQPDDEFRRIDWAATARAGRPIVRTYRAERNQVVLMLVDNGRVSAGRVDDVPRVEHAMDAAMMLTAVAGHLGDRVGLVAFDRQVRAVVPPAAGRGQLGTVTEALFDLEPSLDESDYRGAFRETLARFKRRSLLVLFTDLVEQAVGESLLPALPLLVAHHVVVVVAVQDPEVARWITEVPVDSEEVYRQAGALATLADRRRAAARLEAMGVTVIDEPAGKVAGRLADVYLGIKATGRL